jgi:hypothetical protein
VKEIRINVDVLAQTYGLELPVSVHLLREKDDKPVLLIEEVK